MRHQLRLLDQNLPGLTRELALACRAEIREIPPDVSGSLLYRTLYRAIRDVFRVEVQAFRFCGATLGCEHSLEPKHLVRTFAHEAFPGERIHVYIADGEMTAKRLRQRLVHACMTAVVRDFPKQPFPGLSPRLHSVLERCLYGRVFFSERCGETPLCSMNEPVDPWDRSDPANRVHHRAHVGR